MEITTVAVADLTYTFLFSDIEGSTPLWRDHPDAARRAVAWHDSCFAEIVARHSGRIFKSIGDAHCCVFPNAPAALLAAVAIQRQITCPPKDDDPGVVLPVRIALHSGVAEERDGDYFGLALSRASRLRDSIHGGQIALTATAAALVDGLLPAGATLRDLGKHRLRDFDEPDAVIQVCHPDLRADFPPLRTGLTVPNNLPRQLSSFVGRDREIAEVSRRLMETPLLTLLGSGGCGKTRLSLQVAEARQNDFPDGVWFADFAPITDPALLPRAVASALRVGEEAGRPLTETLASYLSGRTLLLILDNCEHLIDAVAPLAETLLRAAPHVRVVATSREALGVGGEVAWPVPTLSFPRQEQTGRLTPKRLMQYEAPHLFVERATAAQPAFVVGAAEVEAVATVCRRLDGIPLALEIAASWASVLSVGQIAERIEDRFKLLRAGGSRTALPRQKTLRAAIEWSYDLLEECDRALLRRLSVFSGGWTLESAEAVCATPNDEEDTLDCLFRLVKKSLIVVEYQAGTTRYRLLETVRQYAQDALATAGETDAFATRHLAHFSAQAKAAQLNGADQKRWLGKLEAEHDNFRAALGRNAGLQRERAQLALSLVPFWMVHGHAREAARWVMGLLEEPELELPAGVRAHLHNVNGTLLLSCNDLDAALIQFHAALPLWESTGNDRGKATSLCNLGIVNARSGYYDEAIRHYEEGAALYRQQGAKERLADVLSNQGGVYISSGNYAEARVCLDEALILQQASGDFVGAANALQNMAECLSYTGQLDEALRLCLESLKIRHNIGDRNNMATAFDALASIYYEQKKYNAVVQLWSAAECLRNDLNAPLKGSELTSSQKKRATLRAILGEEIFDTIWLTTELTTLDQKIEFALTPQSESEKHEIISGCV